MKAIPILLCAAALLLAVTASACAQQAGTLRIPPDQWQFHPGDDMRCAAVNSAGCAWLAQTPPTLNGNTTYWKRVQITLPEDLRKTPELGLLAGDKFIPFEVYANGQLIGRSGGPELLQTESGAGFLKFPGALAPDGRLVLAIRSFPQWRARVLNTAVPYVVAPADQMQTAADAQTMSYLRVNATHYLCFAAVGFAGFVFLLLYSVNHRLWENLWIALSLSAVASLRVVEIAPIVHTELPVWLDGAIYLSANSLMPLFLIQFVFSFLNRPVPVLLRVVQVLGLCDVYFAFGLPVPPFMNWWGVHGTAVAILLASLTQLLMLPTCFRSKLPEMRWIGASVLFIAVENSARMAKQIGLPSPTQDVFWHGYDIDLRGLSFLLFAIVMLIAMTFRLRRIQTRNRQIEQEMAAARSIQQILIPDHVPQVPGLHIESAYLPAQEVGGDFFQVLPIPNQGDPDQPSAFIVLGDVSGKGLKAAMTVSLLVGTMRAFAETYRSPAELLTGLNRLLHGRADGFATCLALMVTPSGQLTLANAGHPNPYLNGAEISTEANLPLGLTPEVNYSEISLQLAPDQRFTLVTDGVVEAASATTRELFGFDRTQAISAQAASFIAETARAFGQGSPQADDITVLTIARALQPA